ncbi:MAG: molecular chaperone TorD family protein [Rhodocyclaceae bacterium]|jgi:TorA maturation chaperone TorD|nr:molecular chaperone TorD family protein [Rhodocyclaceae bacterium]MCO5096743.1 molecular chaperone TorD family protein [Rhodocyclaceae bacterium]MCZ7656183.1 molecular chaperone TorD family protein [Rhodocyclaceae bacterium]
MTATKMLAPTHPVDPQDEARADFYGLMARLFYAAPDAALLEALAGSAELEAEAAGSVLPAAWGALCRAAREASPEAVRAEYEQTFIGIGKAEVLLYGSFYLTGFLNEKPLAVLRSDLAELGFARNNSVSEPEDHIAGLADIMRHLILDQDNAPAARDAAQQQFFARHIEPWYGSLFDAVDAAPGTDFYRTVAGLGRTFLDLEKEYFRIE